MVFSQKEIPSFISISKIDSLLADSMSISYSISYIDSNLKITKTIIPFEKKLYNSSYSKKLKEGNTSLFFTLFEGKLVYTNQEVIITEKQNNTKIMRLEYDESQGIIKVFDINDPKFESLSKLDIMCLFDKKGKVEYMGNYSDGKRHGKWNFKNSDGTYITKMYINGKILE